MTVEQPPPAPREESDVVEIEVEDENWGVVRVFNAMDTQWCFTSVNTAHACAVVRTGLNYSSLPLVAGAHGVAVDEVFLSGIRLMEQETVSISAQRNKRQLRAG